MSSRFNCGKAGSPSGPWRCPGQRFSRGSLERGALALAPPAAYFGLKALQSQFLEPYIMGRSLELNPVAIFVSLIFWGRVWGAPGVLVAVNIACRHFPSWAPLGNFLARK